jgi:chromosome partitioning protein
MDLRAMRKTVELLKLVKVPAFALLNNVPSYGAIADEAANTIATDLGLPVCPVRFGDRVAYNRCLISGQVAQELEPLGKAAREVEQLYMWTCEQLRMSTLKHARKLTGGHDEPLRRRIA